MSPRAKVAPVDAPVIPPCDLGLEATLLGGVFYDPKVLTAVVEAPPEIFFKTGHRELQGILATLSNSLVIGATLSVAEVAAASAAEGISVTTSDLNLMHLEGFNLMGPDRAVATLRELAAQREEASAAVMAGALVALPPEKQKDGWLDVAAQIERAVALREGTKLEPAWDSKVTGDGVALTWPTANVEIQAEAPHDTRDGVSVELSVFHGPSRIYWARINLASGPTRAQVAKALKARAPRIDWTPMLETLAYETTVYIRAGDPVIELVPSDTIRTDDEVFAAAPLVSRSDITVVFGDGGTFKSFLAIALGLTVSTGHEIIPGVPATPGPTELSKVLFLDYEADQGTFEERLGQICRANHIEKSEVEGRLFYKRMAASLAESAAEVRKLIKELGITMVVLDSLAPACGPEPEGADATTRTFSALRSFGPGVGKLITAHVSKVMADFKGKARPYGSVFNANLARDTWEVVRSGGQDGALTVGLYHRKTNRVSYPDIVLDIAFVGDTLTITPGDGSHHDEQDGKQTGKPQRPQVLAALKDSNAPMTCQAIADATDLLPTQVKYVLRDLRQAGAVVLVDKVAKLWALVTTTHTGASAPGDKELP